jgi:hypothetical protein
MMTNPELRAVRHGATSAARNWAPGPSPPRWPKTSLPSIVLNARSIGPLNAGSGGVAGLIRRRTFSRSAQKEPTSDMRSPRGWPISSTNSCASSSVRWRGRRERHRLHRAHPTRPGVGQSAAIDTLGARVGAGAPRRPRTGPRRDGSVVGPASMTMTPDELLALGHRPLSDEELAALAGRMSRPGRVRDTRHDHHSAKPARRYPDAGSIVRLRGRMRG